ncbi:MAG: hypothetical protein WCA22_10720 [Candidatus Binatus sp.]
MTTVARKSEAVPYDEKTSTISAYGPARSTIKGTPLSPDELRDIDAYWRASLYLCLGMLYLKENPLLREPLTVGLSLLKTWSAQKTDPVDSSVTAAWMTPMRDEEDLASEPRLEKDSDEN